jgi:hypothetical protein
VALGGEIDHATPTKFDGALYRTARTGKTVKYVIPVKDGRYDVHLKFGEMSLKDAGKRPMDIAVNGKVLMKDWDAVTWSGKTHMCADLRFEDIIPTPDGNITITLTAKGEEDAMIQGIEIE